jgi:hypothetical protein
MLLGSAAERHQPVLSVKLEAMKQLGVYVIELSVKLHPLVVLSFQTVTLGRKYCFLAPASAFC